MSTAVSPTQNASAPAAAPWGYGDMAKAIVAVIVGTLVAGGFAGFIATALVESGQDIEDNATAYTIALIPSMIVVEFVLLGAAIWFGPRKYGLSLAALGLRKPQDASPWLPGALAIAGLALIYGYDGACSLIGIEPDVSTPDQVFQNAGPFIVVAVGAVILAPVIEEVFFRGFIFGGLRERRGWVLAAIVSGLLFGLAHLSLYVVPPFAALGFLFAWSYQRTDSIKPSIVAHAIINVVSVGIGLIAAGSI